MNAPQPVEVVLAYGQTLKRFESPFGTRWVCDCGFEPPKFSGPNTFCWHLTAHIFVPAAWPEEVKRKVMEAGYE